MSRNYSSHGFTIIELTISMSFVALLLIAVATLSIQLTNQYTRGLTLKEVAQAGTEVSNDIKRTMAQAQIQGAGIRTKNISGGGTVLCTGAYSYIASSPASLEANNGAGNNNAIRVGPEGTTNIARFAKVRDLSGMLCSTNVLDTTKAYVTNDVSELLSSGSRLLAVQGLTVSPNGMPADTHPHYRDFQQGKGLYTVSLTISAGMQSEILSTATDQEACKTPDSSEANLNFCAINRFEFASRVGSTNRQ